LNVITTWFPDCVTLCSTDQTELTSSPENFFIRLKVNATSAAVIGVPSFHLTPLRMVNVRVLLLLLHAQAVASHGVVFAFCKVLTNTSGSYTWPKVTPVAVLPGLNGLKLQFHCVPWVSAMTSVPLGPLAELAVDPDDDDAEELHAATAAASSTAAPVTISRLIGVVLHW